MKTVFLILAGLFALWLLVGCSTDLAGLRRTETPKPQTILPPPPSDVTELKFSDFFVTPVGPEGLAVTDKLRNLDDRRVRMLGYMVRQEGGVPGQFLFCALPVQLHDHDSALADDLPPATVYVTVPTCRDREVPYAPGLMLLTGMLSVGQREEGDGRISIARLALDPPARGEGKVSAFTGKAARAGSYLPPAR
jgi:hypothetical protein